MESSQNTEEEAKIFSALADPTRLKLVKLLSQQQEPEALCVNALAGLLEVSQSAISQHLRILKEAGLVKGQRRGNHMHYSVNKENLERLHKIVPAVTTGKRQDDPCQGRCPNGGRKAASGA